MVTAWLVIEKSENKDENTKLLFPQDLHLLQRAKGVNEPS